VTPGVTFEKLLRSQFAKIKLRQDALQNGCLFYTFCIPQILAVWEENGLFQLPQARSLTDREVRRQTATTQVRR